MVDLKKIYGNAFKDIIDELYSYISAENNGRNVIDLNSYVFDGKDASDIKYLGHYNIHDAFLLLKEIAENNNIDINISAEISLSDLSGYINGDVYNFKFIIKNDDNHLIIDGKIITILLFVKTIIDTHNNNIYVDTYDVEDIYYAFLYKN